MFIVYERLMIKNKILQSLNKAEYIFRPGQFFKRFIKPSTLTSTFSRVELPWGKSIEVSRQEDIGQAIIKLGLYDLTVSEMIHRLCLDPNSSSKVVMDVGANIGYMSSVMTHSLSSSDKVFSFEPHPAIFERLCRNINYMSGPQVFAHELALSDEIGEMRFMLPQGWLQNEGLGFLDSSLTQDKIKGAKFLKNVKTTTLDSFASEKGLDQIFLMKVDTEGNELAVLKGASALLAAKKIKTIIYEDHRLYPTEVSSFLESFGYHVYFLKRGLLKPQLKEGREATPETWEPNSFIATVDMDQVLRASSGWGWKILR